MTSKLLYLLYLILLKNTPEDYRPYALFFPLLRNWAVKNYLKKCGENPRVKKGAEISPYAVLGNNCTASITNSLFEGNEVSPDDTGEMPAGAGVRIFSFSNYQHILP